MTRRRLTAAVGAAALVGLAGAGAGLGAAGGGAEVRAAPRTTPAAAPAPRPSVPARAEGREVRVTLTEWRVDVEPARVRPGRVTFAEVNRGRAEHDLLLVRTDRRPDRLPQGLEGPAPEVAGRVLFGRVHRHEAAGAHADDRTRHLRPGAVRSRTVTLKPGRYVLICPLPGHYEAGQRAALVVG